MLPTINMIKIVGVGSKPALAAQRLTGRFGTVLHSMNSQLLQPAKSGSSDKSDATPDLAIETNLFQNCIHNSSI